MSNKIEVFTLKAGTLIKLEGMPFQLAEDTEILGIKENFEYAMSEKDNPVDKVNS